MYRVFRGIKRRLIAGENFNTYLVYSVGEFVLVVLGIVIALQIDNWNDRRKARNEEVLILQEIRGNLEYDLSDFTKNLVHFENIQISSKHLLKAIETNLDNHDSLSFHMYLVGLFPHFSFNKSGYELLKSKGLELISNDSLRQAITNLYEDRYSYLMTWENERIAYNATHINSLKNKYLGTKSLYAESQPESYTKTRSVDYIVSVGGVRKLLNYEALKKDTELISIIKDLETYAALLYWIHFNVQEMITDLVDHIEYVLEELR